MTNRQGPDGVYRQQLDGTWRLAEPMRPTGILGRAEAWCRSRGLPLCARVLAWIDERGLAR
jgi:hypothetical protein